MPLPVTQAGLERTLEEMLARVPGELLLAEDSARERAAGASLDEVEHDFWTDPCHFLRRACQVADYGASVTGCADEKRGASR
jgi:hypothetical protein